MVCFSPANFGKGDLLAVLPVIIKWLAAGCLLMSCRLSQLLEALRQNTEGALIERVGINPPPMMHSGIIQSREYEDPPGLHEKTEFLLREWVNLYHSPSGGLDSSKAFSTFVAQVMGSFDKNYWVVGSCC